MVSIYKPFPEYYNPKVGDTHYLLYMLNDKFVVSPLEVIEDNYWRLVYKNLTYQDGKEKRLVSLFVDPVFIDYIKYGIVKELYESSENGHYILNDNINFVTYASAEVFDFNAKTFISLEKANAYISKIKKESKEYCDRIRQTLEETLSEYDKIFSNT